jgi:pimeloyl-ACP methyl ester carboxylesterase
MISIMARNDAQLRYQDWNSKSAQPIVFRHGSPSNSATRGCITP